jgi:hypothetical protein
MKNKKESKILKAAKAAQEDGYLYMISLTREIFRTKYWNVVPISKILENGRWLPKHPCYRGTTSAKLPQWCITRKEALRKYCK